MQIIEATDFGVRSAVIRLRSRDTPMEFVIYPMIHMASRSFYADVTERLKTADVIVAEGVGRGLSRRGSVLVSALTLSYRVMRFNRRMDVVEQRIDYAALAAPVVRPDVNAEEFRSSWRRVPFLYRFMMWSYLPFVMLAHLVGATDAIWSRALEENDLPSEEDEAFAESFPELERAFGGDRDERLLEALGTLHEERGQEPIEVAIVYGAGHVAAIVHALNNRYGYIPRLGDWLTVFDLTGPAVTPAPTPRSKQTAARTAAPERPTPAAAEPEPTLASTRRPKPDAVSDGRDHSAEVTRLRAMAAKDPDTYLARLARELMAYSDQLADQARPGEALEAADEATDISEELRQRFGATYDKTYGWAAFTLGQRLHVVGRGDDTAALYAEAVEVFRTTNSTDPYERARSLGTALAEHAGQLQRHGHHEEAAAAAQEAIELFRTASARAPDELHRPWAFALQNLTDALRSLNRAEAALQAAKRGVTIAERLAKRRPEQAGILVDNLIRLAQAHRDLGAKDDAVAAARDSVQAARVLTAGQDLGERSALGAALAELGSTLSFAQKRDEGIAAAAAAVAVWRAVAQAHPIQRPALAVALARHARLQWQAGAGDFGLASADEAEALARDLVTEHPEAHRTTLQHVISYVWRSFDHNGQGQRAVALTEERVRILSDATAGDDVLAHAKEDHARALKSSHAAEGAG